MRILIVDDEPLALDLLEDNISKVPYLQLVARCEDALEAMKVMQHENIDLIFLDIQMPGLTGLQFIQTMAQKPMVILVTAYEKFALEGFNLDVTDYLVKPVALDRFIKACNKAKELYDLKQSAREPATAIDPGYFFVHVDYTMVKITTADIVFIEGLKDYIKIHLKSSQKPVVTRMPMKTIEEQLPSSSFLRIHKSYIVALDKVSGFSNDCVTAGSFSLPVGRSFKQKFLQYIGV